jgi:hypothetical protein
MSAAASRVEPEPAHDALPDASASAGWPHDKVDVENRLIALAWAEAPLRRAATSVAGSLARSQAWERLGFARIGDYARERAGISGRQLYELAHMHGAFQRVPRLADAFVGGAISWSQACLLARVVTPENVESWLASATSMSARALAREVRAVDRRAREAARVSPGEQDDSRVGLGIQMNARSRAKWFQARLLASQAAGQRLSYGELAEAVMAELLSATGLEPGTLEDAPLAAPPGRPADKPGDKGGEDQNDPEETGVPAWRHPAPESLGAPKPFRPPPECLPGVPASLPWVAALTEDLDSADAFELDARLRRILALEQQRLAQMGPLLGFVAWNRRYRRLGFASLGAFVREWLGMSERTAQALLRIERACALCRPLQEAWRRGRISWVQAHALVRIAVLDASTPFHAAWVEHAGTVSVRRLEEDVERALALGSFDPQVSADPTALGSPTPGSAFPPDSAASHHEARRPGRVSCFRLCVPREVKRLLRATLATVQREIERRENRTSSESEAFERMLDHALETWTSWDQAGARHHRIYARDGWRCVVPGCTSYRNLHAHHVRFRSRHGSDAAWNLTTLCAWHHQRAVHGERVVRIVGRAPDRLRFELGVRPGQAPLAVYRSGDRRWS